MANRTHPKSPHARRIRRQEEAKTRQAEYDALTWEEKANRWADRVKSGFGEGKKQKAKLSMVSIPAEEDLF